MLDDRVDPPEPGPGEVLVRPTRVAIGRDELGSQAAVGVPVVAIGGIDASNIEDVVRAGADVVAVISAVCGADDPRAAARQLAAQFEQ